MDVDDSYASARPGLEPGRYVRLRVSDDGTGMDQATLERALDPFFTTNQLQAIRAAHPDNNSH